MDYFSLCLNFTCLVFQGAMHIAFSSGLTEKRQQVWHFAVYIFLLCTLDWFAGKASLPWGIAIGAELFLLYGMNRLALGNRASVSWTAAILAIYIAQLSFGIMNSAELLLFPYIIGKPLLYLLVIAATAASLAICAACYAIIVKSAALKENRQLANISCLLFPVMFFFTAELYILQTSYTQTVSVPNDLSPAFLLENVGKHTALLFLQLLGLGALLCTLYAYRQLCRSLQAQAEIQSLTQAVQAQKIYITEAQMRYQQTKAFRHDIKNHLSVLNGLLKSKKLDESIAYLQKLETASASLSFPYQTGNPVVDILLGEKLGLAKTDGITAEVSLLLPDPCGINDFDLCVIFANALDNAIHACQSVKETKLIRIIGERQGDFYMLAFQNTCSDEPMPPPGTGLSNINFVAEKYHGAVLTEKTNRHFSLNVLLNISLHPESSSIQKP